MDMKRLGLGMVVLGLVLMLVTVYLAMFHATMPQTSVGAAGEVLSSVEGSGIKVAGFVAVVGGFEGSEDPLSVESVRFSLADFVDYQRYLSATPDELNTTQWWTVRPIDVQVRADAPELVQQLTQVYVDLEAGKNLSVSAKVIKGSIGPDSAVTGSYLLVSGPGGLEFGVSAASFEIMSAPVAQKIFYFHMPSAWVSYIAFFVTLIGSAAYLRTGQQGYDRLAFCSAELGVLFATLAIATGPVWAKQEWGVYWRWNDTKLVTTFVLWLVYIGYLSLRAAVSEPSAKARLSAVYGVLGFVTVPMSLLSSRIAPLLQSSHPKVIATQGGGLSPEAGMTIGVAVVAFTVLYIAILIRRIGIAEAEEELEELKRAAGGEE